MRAERALSTRFKASRAAFETQTAMVANTTSFNSEFSEIADWPTLNKRSAGELFDLMPDVD